MISAPRDVVVRLGDFNTNEYADSVSGRQYEPVEENPTLDFGGASRYDDQWYRDAFARQCRAMKRVRDEMGLVNVKPMVSFGRTVEEGRLVLKEKAKQGLSRGENGWEVYVMCEIPSNGVLAEQFAEVFDGFSIGSNDLTQRVLGGDRDSEVMGSYFRPPQPSREGHDCPGDPQGQGGGREDRHLRQDPCDEAEFTTLPVEQGARRTGKRQHFVEPRCHNQNDLVMASRHILELE